MPTSSSMDVTPRSKDTPMVTGSEPPLLTDANRVWPATMKRSSDPSCALSARTPSMRPSSSSTRTPTETELPASPPTVTSRESSRLRSRLDRLESTSLSPSLSLCSPSLVTRPPCGELLTSTVSLLSTSTPPGRLSLLDGRKRMLTSTLPPPTCPLSSEHDLFSCSYLPTEKENKYLSQ